MSVCLTNPNTKDYFYGDPSCIPEDLVKMATRTKHKWRFNLSDTERQKVAPLPPHDVLSLPTCNFNLCSVSKLLSTVNSIHSTTESTQPFKVAVAPSSAITSSRSEHCILPPPSQFLHQPNASLLFSYRPVVRPRSDPPVQPEVSKGGIMTPHLKATYKVRAAVSESSQK